VRAQAGALYTNSIVVIGPADTLRNAWAGGLNTPQFSAIDLDNDGRKDLLVFDRADGQYIPLRNAGAAGQRRFTFAPQFGARFPARNQGGWVLLADYDGDGREDLFCDTLSGIKVWRNVRNTASGPQFSQRYPLLFTALVGPGGSRTPLPVFCASSNLPGLADVDGDGDLDLLNWNVSGGNLLTYDKNFAVEDLGRADTFRLLTASQCWGRFLEVFDPATGTTRAQLNYTACVPFEFKTDHEGGTVLPINLNGDTLMDIIITDAGVANALGLINGGSRRFANMVSVTAPYPAGANPIQVNESPACFYLDVNNDGRADLIAAPNDPATAQDVNGVWLYRNTGATNNPNFVFERNDFLQAEMLDVGSAAVPAFTDFNADGLPDLVIAGTRWVSTTQNQTTLNLYQNVGTAAQPVFKWINSDWLGLASLPATQNVLNLAPTFSDLDGDGDEDLLLGFFSATVPNTLLYFKNETLPGGAPRYVLQDADYLGMGSENVNRLAPHLADADGDGDYDLIVGTGAGKLYFYQNQGTALAPRFVLQSRTWGGVDVSDAQNTAGNAKPLLADLNADGRLELLVGSASGFVRVYGNVSAATGATFTNLGNWLNNDFGRQAAPAAIRLDDSGLLFYLVGTQRGGINLLKLAGQLPLRPGVYAGPANAFAVFPNPATGVAYVAGPPGTVVEVYLPTGARWQTFSLPGQGNVLPISLQGWPAGLYILRAVVEGRRQTFKLVVR
jgi:hypothetical protein